MERKLIKDIAATIPMRQWFHPELWAWVSALFMLGFFPPQENSISLCPLDLLGWWCPGDGLGMAVSQVLHLEIMTSLNSHILGIPVTLFLILRSTQLLIFINSTKPQLYANTKIFT